ncbi:MAG: class I SAM-dependent methyltransferase [Anaerostipes sp.]|nr:class I SAM-dependent methyltransferase [Anaerostipes sp.]
MKTSQHLIEFYNNYDEDNRLEPKHGMVEFFTTMRYIQQYLKSGERVLEVGAGTGRYSHALARQGYIVDAVELVEHNIEIFRKNTQENKRITVHQGNALDLSAFPDNQYDITLVLGPLYHLYTIDEKRQAIREAIRVTKLGGIIFAAYVISDGCLLDEGFRRNNINVMKYIQMGLLDSETFAAKSKPQDLFELVRKEDVDELMSVFPTTRLHYVATDGLALMMREVIDRMDEEMFELFLKYHYVTCERSDFVGVTSHALDIFKNKKKS